MTLLKKVFRTQKVGRTCPFMLTFDGTFPQFGSFLATKWDVGPDGWIILEFFQRSHPLVHTCPSPWRYFSSVLPAVARR